MKIQSNKTKTTTKLLNTKIVYALPFVLLALPATTVDSAYATVYGYYATEPAPGFGWNNLTYLEGNSYTYGGNIASGSGPYHYINRMVWMTDLNGYSVGTGYYDATDGNGNEYYHLMYYVDDDPTNDNLTFITAGVPAIGHTYTPEIEPYGDGISHDFSFYSSGSSVGSYQCQYECGNNIKIAGASAWGDLTQTSENTQTDISSLQLQVDTSSKWYTWSGAQGETKCDTTYPNVYLNNNELQVNLANSNCASPSDVWLYNDGGGG